MTPQEMETLLLLAVALLIVVSFYTVWLWFNLLITRWVINSMPIIQPTNGHDSAQPGGGCTTLLFIVLLVVLVIGLLSLGG